MFNQISISASCYREKIIVGDMKTSGRTEKLKPLAFLWRADIFAGTDSYDVIIGYIQPKGSDYDGAKSGSATL